MWLPVSEGGFLSTMQWGESKICYAVDIFDTRVWSFQNLSAGRKKSSNLQPETGRLLDLYSEPVKFTWCSQISKYFKKKYSDLKEMKTLLIQILWDPAEAVL